MRFPVFARRSNPSVDSPILRKSKTYIEAQVAAALANWVDPADPRKGIIAREMLYFGQREFQAETADLTTFPAIELPGLHLEFPKNCEGVSMASVRGNWEWHDYRGFAPTNREQSATA
jgi:hypothetical protein